MEPDGLPFHIELGNTLDTTLTESGGTMILKYLAHSVSIRVLRLLEDIDSNTVVITDRSRFWKITINVDKNYWKRETSEKRS